MLVFCGRASIPVWTSHQQAFFWSFVFEPREFLLARYNLLQEEQPTPGPDSVPAPCDMITAFALNIQPQSYLWKGGCLSFFF